MHAWPRIGGPRAVAKPLCLVSRCETTAIFADALALVRLLRQENSDASLFVFARYLDLEQRLLLFDVGVDACVREPFFASELIESESTRTASYCATVRIPDTPSRRLPSPRQTEPSGVPFQRSLKSTQGKKLSTFTTSPNRRREREDTYFPTLNHLPRESERSLSSVAYRKQTPRSQQAYLV
jgi:CheY-like chemotaxis protein